jgi:hypothetical protein
MSEVFAYVDCTYVSQRRRPTLQGVALQVFRTAVNDAYSSRELAAAALDACSAIRDDDKQRLVAAKSIARLSAEVIECTKLDIVVKREVKLAEICLKQLRTSLKSDLASTSDEQHKASLREQLRVVTSVLAGKLTLNELYEHWGNMASNICQWLVVSMQYR